MKRLLSTIAVLGALAALTATPASAAFGLHDLDLTFTGPKGESAMQAGSHPYAFNFDVAVNTTEKEGILVPDEELKDLISQLPPGFVANPTAVPPCTAAEFAAGLGEANCPDASSLGVFDLIFGFGQPEFFKVPVYNLVPPPGSVLRIGFKPAGVPVVVDGGLNPDPPYNAFANSLGTSQAAFFYSGTLRLWGNPADPTHNAERGKCASSNAADTCPANVSEQPFTLLPRSCTGPLHMQIKARSWQNPQSWLEPPDIVTHDDSEPPQPLGMTGCSKLPFSPEIDSQLSTDNVSSPSGLAFNLDIKDPGISAPEGIAASDIKRAEVTFPEGVTINPSQAEGLAVCSEAQLDRESASSAPNEGCPEASKIGSVEVETPLLEDKVLKGALFVAAPFENPFNSLIALYMTIKSPELGIDINLAGKVIPDPKTGQIVGIFDDLPQAPFSHFRLRFREGGRSPLISPPSCGSFQTEATFTPWANPDNPYTTTSEFRIDHGIAGAPCPSGPQPFEPGFQAGSKNNSAGAYSPFSTRLTRRDGDRDLTRFDVTLPPGVVGKLAGVSKCPDAQISLAKAKTGKAELRSPSCPLNSLIGSVKAGAGVGSQLTYVPGSLYMGGPFGGAPLSVISVVPAVAGPFDVGTVVTRFALQIDPRTAKVSVDGSKSDPIPHMLAGIPLAVRDVQAYVDRSGFTLNPTSCDPFAAKATIWGQQSPVQRSDRYQASSCSRLGFKPKLILKLKGGTKRGDHPKLKGTFKPRQGDANLEDLVLRLPRSAFLDQAHIRTICTRVQFAAKACPQGAIYGHATAYTPLLSEPLEGPVYLRSSNHNLPDFVAALHGIIDIEAVARIDSKKGGIRATFSDLPDAPITKVVVDMQGGKKGLIVNSTSLCERKHRANVALTGQNGKTAGIRPVVGVGCG